MSVQPPEPAVPQSQLLAEYERQRQEQVQLDQQLQAEYAVLFQRYLAGALTAAATAVFMDLLAAVVQRYAALSADVFATGYQALRVLSGATTPMPRLFQPPVILNELWIGQRVTALWHLDRGNPGAALVTGAGSAMRIADDPYRQLMHNLVNVGAQLRGAEPIPPKTPIEIQRADPDLIGWIRVTDGDPCAFCAMLASRGAVYATAESALYREDGELYHDSCGCVPMPVFVSDPELPVTNVLAREVWDEFAKGRDDPRNAFRRAWESRSAA